MRLPKTLVIGLDGATYSLIKPWAEAGLLPTFAHLLKHGGHATLDAYPHLNSAAAWTNIITGYNPGKHSIFSFTMRERRKGITRPTSARDRRKPAFWHPLSAAGLRVGVMNVPITYPAEQTNGFMVSGMDTPDTKSKGFTTPAGIFQELDRAGIHYVIDVPDISRAARQATDGVPPMVRDMTLARTAAFIQLLEKYPCDVAMLVYIGSDRMSHYFWRTTPPDKDAPEWKPLRDLFILYDRQLAEILEHADSGTTVFVLSDHGFETMGPKYLDINTLLERTGYLTRHSRPSKSTVLGSLLRFGRRTMPGRWQRSLAMRFTRVHERALHSNDQGSVDWAHTRAYANKGGVIRINAQRHSSHGIVSDTEYDALWQELASVMLGLTDPETGRPVVSKVHHPNEFYSGPFAEDAGDMYLRWNRGQMGKGFAYRQNGFNILLKPNRRPGEWLGNHHPEGIFIAYGDGIRRGITHAPVTHYDLVPTLLYLNDQPIAEDMDGRVLTDWLEPERAARHAVKKQAASEYAPQDAALDEADNAMIENRLRSLGYLE